MITLRQIQFALAVARHRHFKRAAEECNISQSALSLGIAEMEKNLGIAIFERNNKQVIITPLGNEILERAQKIYLDAQQLVERAHVGQQALIFSMNLGFIPTIAPFMLPEILPLIRKNHPNFKTNIHENHSDQLIHAVQTGRLDAAVLALPFEIGGLDAIEFGQENFWVIMHKEHPLSQEKQINSAQLKATNLLMLDEEHCLRQHVLDVCQMHHDLSKENFKEASLNTLIQLTANNMGVTLVPEMALPQMKLYDTLHYAPLNIPGPHRRLAIITRPNYPRFQDLQILSSLFSVALQKTIQTI